jgi:hypothetical protein
MILKYSSWSATSVFNEGRFFATPFFDLGFSFSWKIPSQECMNRSDLFRGVHFSSRNWGLEI